MKKIKKIGILCEDKSDCASIKILVKRIIKIESISIYTMYSGGCAKLKRKARDYSIF